MSKIKKFMFVALVTVICGNVFGIDSSFWNNTSDYGYQWWTYGVDNPNCQFTIQTNHYGMVFQYNNFTMWRFGPIASPPSESAAVTSSNDFINNNVTTAAMTATLIVGGTRYNVVSQDITGTTWSYERCKLIQSGKFFQHRYLTNLVLATGAPAAASNLEIYAWPDRICFAFDLTAQTTINNAVVEIAIDVGPAFSTVLQYQFCKALATSTNGSGYIFATDDGANSLILDQANTIACIQTPVANLSSGQTKRVGMIVYPVATNCNSELQEAQRKESPLTVTAQQILPTSGSLNVGYSYTEGAYIVSLLNDVFPECDGNYNDFMEEGSLTITNNTAYPREIRLKLDKGWTCDIAGRPLILCDDFDYPVGVPVQMSKLWDTSLGGKYGSSRWYNGFTMFTVPANSTINLHYLIPNHNWGRVPAATFSQLCLAGWGGAQEFNESAIGAYSETTTYIPYTTDWESDIGDCRPLLTWAMNICPTTPWAYTNNVGGGNFLCLWDSSGVRRRNIQRKTQYVRHCPSLTEAIYSAVTDDGKINMKCTLQNYRTDDVTRGIYHIRYDVTGTVPVQYNPSGNIKRIAFFQLGAYSSTNGGYNQSEYNLAARGNSTGLIEQWAPQKGSGYGKLNMACTGTAPWFSMHQGVSRDTGCGAWANRGFIIRSYTAKLGGVQNNTPYARESGINPQGVTGTCIELTAPSGISNLLAGDYVEADIELVIMPQFANGYYGPNTNLYNYLTTNQNTYLPILRETKGNNLQIAVSTGSLLKSYPIKIQAASDIAQFTVTGGLGYVPVTFINLTNYKGYILQRKDAGNGWDNIDQSYYGNDYWQTDRNTDTGTFELTYNVPLDSSNDDPQTVEFRLVHPGVWSYGYKSDSTLEADVIPFSHTDYPYYTGFAMWGSAVTGAYNEQCQYNPSTGYHRSEFWGVNTLFKPQSATLAQRNNARMPVYRFTAPADGNYTISASFWGAVYSTGGTTSDVWVVKNCSWNSIIFGWQAINGFVGGDGLNAFGSNPSVSFGPTTVSLAEGDVIDFIAYDPSLGVTGVDATITKGSQSWTISDGFVF